MVTRKEGACSMGKRIKEFERRKRDREDVGASKERTISKRNTRGKEAKIVARNAAREGRM
jgi:hypothetical protein